MTSQEKAPDYNRAAIICLCGVLLHIALSDPLLNALGFDYSGDGGMFYEKIHPGMYLIAISFVMFLWHGFNPLRNLLALCRQQQVFMALLFVNMLALAYMALRSGAQGLAFMVDTHISAVLCAIMFSYAPKPLCRKAVNLLITAALVNGITGIAEALGKFRVLTFAPDWPVLHEDYFRASAFMGHPLDNAIFTAVMLFVAMAMDYPKPFKVFTVMILVTALVAFGGRAALFYSLAGLFILAGVFFWEIIKRREMTRAQLHMISGVMITVPVFLAALAWPAMHGGMGERLAGSILQWEESADTRRLAFSVFRYMKDEEIWFGISSSRILDIDYRANLDIPLSDIENPWIMMCMNLGLIVFPFWLAAALAFALQLMVKNPSPLWLAVLTYFLIASTANSFGRKDANFLIMTSAVVCAGRLKRKDKEITAYSFQELQALPQQAAD